jgi:hypothetical protein
MLVNYLKNIRNHLSLFLYPSNWKSLQLEMLLSKDILAINVVGELF